MLTFSSAAAVATNRAVAGRRKGATNAATTTRDATRGVEAAETAP